MITPATVLPLVCENTLKALDNTYMITFMLVCKSLKTAISVSTMHSAAEINLFIESNLTMNKKYGTSHLKILRLNCIRGNRDLLQVKFEEGDVPLAIGIYITQYNLP